MAPDRVQYGKIVHAFIKAGWNPPRPNDRIVELIAEDIDRVTRERRGFGRDMTATLELAPSHVRMLRLAAEGFDTNQIAAELGIGFETVKTGLKIIRDRLGARNTAHAVAIAIRRGLIDVTDPARQEAA